MTAGLEFFKVCLPAIFSIVDPIAVVPIYLGLVGTESPADQRRTAVRAVITATSVLVVFALTGKAIFHFFGIEGYAFRVAGGVLMATMALEMMRAKRSTVKSSPEETEDAMLKSDVAITPIGIPLLSGPGAIASAIVWSSKAQLIEEKAALFASIGVVMVLTLVSLIFGSKLVRFLGQTGINVVTRIMGLILAATAAQFVIDGWREGMRIL
jgi:multiple antibiotic resistance protein